MTALPTTTDQMLLAGVGSAVHEPASEVVLPGASTGGMGSVDGGASGRAAVASAAGSSQVSLSASMAASSA